MPVASRFDNAVKAPDNLTEDEKKFVDRVYNDFSNAEKPLIITGTGCLSEQVISSAVNAANALQKSGKDLSLSFVFPKANSVGLMLLDGKPLDSLQNVKEKVVINLKNDLSELDEELSKRLSENSKLVTIECLENETTEISDIIIPAGTFAESDGTFVNNEGRAQRYYQVYKPDNKEIMESWRLMARLLSVVSPAAEISGSASGSGNELENDTSGKVPGEAGEQGEGSTAENLVSQTAEISYEDLLEEIAAAVPVLKDITTITPPPGFRIAGQKIPREPHRFSGRTAMRADVNVSEPKPPDDPDSPMTFTMEGYRGEPPSSMIPYFWSPGWNSVQSINKYQIEVGGPLHGGDPGRRLFERNVSAGLSYYDLQLKRFESRKDEYLAVPVYHIFGSEELSAEAPAVNEVIPELCLWMNPDDVAASGIKQDEQAEIIAGEKVFRLPVKIKKGIPRGIVGIPVLPGKTVLYSKPVRRRRLNVNYNDWIVVKKNDS